MSLDEKLKELERLVGKKDYEEGNIKMYDDIISDGGLTINISHDHYAISDDTRQLHLDFMDLTIDMYKGLIKHHENELKLIRKEISDFLNSCSD